MLLTVQDYEVKIIDLKKELDEFKPFNQAQLKNLQERFRI
jgi:hypothetical protein